MPKNARERWNADQVPDQHGRTVVITGANTGIGFETARALAGRGAHVVLAGRDPARTGAALDRIAADTPHASLSAVVLDLASLASIRQCAEQIRSDHPRIDLLINNAGLMMAPYGHTADGLELQLGTNHFGHFALTGLLLDNLVAVAGSRVVTVSSSAHRQGRIDLDDLQFERRRYRPSAAYGQSKLANVLFTNELQRRLAEAGVPTIAVAVEPGFVPTELQRHLAGPMKRAVNLATRILGQSGPAAGALATLRAATDPGVLGGEYFAPDGMLAAAGHPVRSEPAAAGRDVDLQRRLWTESERLTGVRYHLTPVSH